MAFVQDTSAPNPATSSVAKPGDVSNVARLGGLENALEIAGDLVSGSAAQGRAILADEAGAAARGGLNDLLEERSATAGAERFVNQQIEEMGADGKITDDERKVLEGLQGTMDFFKQARQSGILSESGFSTRMNALRRESLARAENLGISSDIEQLFMAGRSLAVQAPEDTELAAMRKTMDGIYGAGNWNAVDMANVVSNNAKAAAISAATNSSINDRVFQIRNTMEQSINGLMSRSNQGKPLTQDDIFQTSRTLQAGVSKVLSEIDNERKVLKAQGLLTAARAEELNKKAKSITDMRDGFQSMLTGDQSFPEYMSLNNQLEAMNKTLELYDKLNMAPSVRGILNVSGGGGNNSALFKEMFTAVADFEKNRQWWEVIAQQDPLGRDADAVYQEWAGQFQAMVNAKSMQQFVDANILPQWGSRFLNLTLNTINAKTPEEVDEALGVLESVTKVVPNDSKHNGNTAATTVQGYDKTMAAARVQGREAQAKASYKRIFLRAAEELSGSVSSKTALRVPVNPDGSFELPVLRADARGSEDILGSSSSVSPDLELHVRAVSALAGKLIKDGIVTPQEVREIVDPEGVALEKTQFSTDSSNNRFGIDLSQGIGVEAAAAAQQPQFTFSNPVQFSQQVAGTTTPPEDLTARIAWEENRGMTGFNTTTGLWSPHKSIEGGNDTIGYGHKLTDQEVQSGVITLPGGEQVRIEDGLTQDQVHKLYTADLDQATNMAQSIIDSRLNGAVPTEVEDVLIQMTYQMGDISDFDKTLDLMAQGEWVGASKEMLKSKWASQTPARAKRVAKDLWLLGMDGKEIRDTITGETFVVRDGKMEKKEA